MACLLFGAKPISELMLAYYQLDHGEQILMKFESQFNHFHWKYHLQNNGHFDFAWMC